MSKISTSHRPFTTTRWSIVLRAKQDQAAAIPGRALEELCELYWMPVYAFVRRQVSGLEESQDLTQAFFTDLLSRSFLKNVDQSHGRFRSWLLSSVRNFLNNQYERAAALKRGGGIRFQSLDWDTGEERYSRFIHRNETAEAIFEREWSLTLLATVLQRLDDEMGASGQSALFEVFRGCLTTERAEFDCAAAADELGITIAAARTAAHRLRKRYRKLLRREIRETVGSEEDVDDEIQCLFRSVGG